MCCLLKNFTLRNTFYIAKASTVGKSLYKLPETRQMATGSCAI